MISENIGHEHPKKNSEPFYPHYIPTRLYEGNDKVHSMTVTRYKNGEPGPKFFISGKVLTEYKYNSRENTFTKKGLLGMTSHYKSWKRSDYE